MRWHSAQSAVVLLGRRQRAAVDLRNTATLEPDVRPRALAPLEINRINPPPPTHPHLTHQPPGK